MEEKYWSELGLLGQRIAVLNRLLDRAVEYGDQQQTRHLKSELAKIEDQRDSVIVAIAELSIAA